MISLATSNYGAQPTAPHKKRRELLTPIPDHPDCYLLVLDNTAAEKFTTCPTSLHNYLVLGREAAAKSPALTYGGALHSGIDALLSGLSIEEQNTRIVNYYAENPVPSADHRTLQCCIETLYHYRKRCELPDYHWELLRDSHSDVILETPFELPLGELEVNAPLHTKTGPVFVKTLFIGWSGRVDCAVRVNGRNYINDHKTTSMGGDSVVQDFQLSNQMLGYVWAAQQLWPEHGILGAHLNFVHLKKHTAGAPLLAKGPRGGPPPLDFFRHTFDYTQERIDWWHNNIMSIISDLVHCLQRNYFPSHTKWCFGKFGKCSYHDVCSLDSAPMRDSLLKSSMFTEVTWNPTN